MSDNADRGCTVPTLTEGPSKGGHNSGESQIRSRPAAPAPLSAPARAANEEQLLQRLTLQRDLLGSAVHALEEALCPLGIDRRIPPPASNRTFGPFFGAANTLIGEIGEHTGYVVDLVARVRRATGTGDSSKSA